MSDRNLHSFYETSNGQTVLLGTVGGQMPVDWSDTLKITSGCTGLSIQADEILGGREDCVDINNRCRDIKVSARRFHPQGKYLATIKGGVSGVVLTGAVSNHGSEVDVDLGNWSDQSDEPVRGVRLELTSATGAPIVVRVLNALKPELSGGPYRYAFPHPDAWYHGLAVWLFLKIFSAIK